MKATANKNKLTKLVERFSGLKVLVVGDVGVDRYTQGSVERISPEAPVPIVLVESEFLKLGLAANVADNVQALGAKASLVGAVGKDRAADDLRNLLKAVQVSDQHLVEDLARRTVLKERIVTDRQQLLRVDYESAQGLSAQATKALLKQANRLIDQVDVLIIEDYAKGTLSESLIQNLIKAARKKRKKVAVDPNAKHPASWYRGTHVFKPNQKESEQLTGIKIRDQKSLYQAGATLLKMTRSEAVIITRGKDGMSIFERGKKPVSIPTWAREVYDVSGAGDTVITVLALAYAAGGSLVEAATLGNIAGGIEVGKRGTATVSPKELLEAL